MTKPPLGFWQIWNMCFGFFGIQVGFGLQNANVSRIFQTLGADVGQIPILWIAAPLTGLIVQPIIGHMSDRTWTRYGRRRPYFFVGALATTLALIVMPNSPHLWIAAGMLWIMDASINITMEPFRAFVGDMLPERQRTAGFAMQSFFIGLGGYLSSSMPDILTRMFSVANEAPPNLVPDSVRFSFYIGAAFLFSAVMWTVFSTKEYSPDELAAFDAHEKRKKDLGYGAAALRRPPAPAYYFALGAIALLAGAAGTFALNGAAAGDFGAAANALNLNELYFVTIGFAVFGVILFLAGVFRRSTDEPNMLTSIVDDMFSMPDTMAQLALVQFFTWFALFAMWIYTTPGVSAHHYGATDPSSPLYNEAANWVGVLFGRYNLIAAAVAFFVIPWLDGAIGRKATHVICLALGGFALWSLYFIDDPKLLWISMIGVGFAWASIVSIPYSILSGALPAEKMGVYMGIFNFFIVIPQMLAASILGVMVRYLLGGEVILALVIGGTSLLFAAIATLFVNDRAARAEVRGDAA